MSKNIQSTSTPSEEKAILPLLLKYIENRRESAYRRIEDSSSSAIEVANLGGRVMAYQEITEWLKVMI